jgi:hypothetical protein
MNMKVRHRRHLNIQSAREIVQQTARGATWGTRYFWQIVSGGLIAISTERFIFSLVICHAKVPISSGNLSLV